MKRAPNRIQYLDGTRFMRVIQAATRRLVEKHGHLNDINVFPVPDGDTGSNMAGTMRNIVTSSAKSIERSIDKMSSTIAQSALMSARGNSGVILAQFLCGFSEGVKDLRRISPADFAKAASKAAHRAMESISDPREGTILTVINDWAAHLKENCHKYQNFHDLLHDSLERAKQSVRSTTDKLASLKKADVVDAGGLGFVYLLEGIVEFTERGSIRSEGTDYVVAESVAPVQEKVAVEDLEYLYCTECLVSSTDAIDSAALRTRLEPLGDSLIVAGTAETVRIHVHTNDPDIVFGIAAEYGDVSCHKYENMLEQHRRLLADAAQQTGILTDSTCDIPDSLLREYNIQVAPLRLFLDDEEYIDKVTISTEEFNARLAGSTSARTSQPAPGDFKSLYEGMQEQFREVAALHVMARYSGTFQSSAAVAKMVWDAPEMLDSGTLTGGLGLVVLQAAKRAREGMSAAEIVRLAARDALNTRVLVSMDTLDFAVRGGRMSRSQGALARLLNIKPVLEFNSREQGKVDVLSKALGPKRCEQKLFAALHTYVDAIQPSRLEFAVTHVHVPETGARYAERIEREFGVAPLYVMPASPVLGCHSGPGACAVSMLMHTETEAEQA